MKGVRVLVTKLVIEDAKVDFCWGISLILTNFPFCDWWFATPFVWSGLLMLTFRLSSSFTVIGCLLEMDAALPHVTSGRAVEYIYWVAVFF